MNRRTGGAQVGDRVLVTDGVPAIIKLMPYQQNGSYSFAFHDIILVQ
jgi:hypothetical protein